MGMEGAVGAQHYFGAAKVEGQQYWVHPKPASVQPGVLSITTRSPCSATVPTVPDRTAVLSLCEDTGSDLLWATSTLFPRAWIWTTIRSTYSAWGLRSEDGHRSRES